MSARHTSTGGSGARRRPLTVARYAGVLAGLLALLILTCFVALGFGSVDLSRSDLWGAEEEGGLASVILRDIRLPRILLGVLAGLALGVAGTAYQAVLRNPLAEPYILGVSGGAALGAILATTGAFNLTMVGMAARPLGAFVGALITIGFIFRVAALRGRASSYSLILIGVVINSFFSALILFIVTVADFTRFQGVLFWLAGSLSSLSYPVLAILGAVLAVGLGILLPMGPALNLLSQGEETAGQLGLHTQRTRVIAITVASLVTAAVVSFAGLIGFVGLMVPHIMRLVLGPDHRLLLPASALAGATFLVIADTLARTLAAPTEIPVGIVTAVCGGPFFIYLYRAQGGSSYFD